MINKDVYFKKTVQYEFGGHKLQFRTSQDLFSSFGIDIGTQRLLRTLAFEKINLLNKVLDLGCGYGPIGIALKTICQSSIVHLVDRNALAIIYSQQNAELNNVKNIKIYPSLGYDDVTETDFDLIISNIPAKVGEPVLTHILKDAQFYLRPGGKVMVVVIDAIAKYVAEVLNDPNINILFSKSWPGHVVYHYEFVTNPKIALKAIKSAFDKGIYDRGEKVISTAIGKAPVQTTYGLPEFDTLSYETELILGKLQIFENHNIEKAIVFNPGQGFLPVALLKYSKVGKIFLIDRNLLALRNSRRNLSFSGYSSKEITLLHQVGISANERNISCIIGVLDEKENRDVHNLYVKQGISELSKGGLIVLASISTAITRVESFVRAEKLLKVIVRDRKKGKSLIILERK